MSEDEKTLDEGMTNDPDSVKVEILDDVEEGEEEDVSEGSDLAEEYLSQIKYLQAEFENYKKIAEREKAGYIKRANERLITDLLPIIDSLEGAILTARKGGDHETLVKGIELIYADFVDILRDKGLSHIDAVGEKFDPYKHEAMMIDQDTDLPEDTVTEELQKGYSLDGTIIRTSKVKVVK
ncbi:MAG: nucleotide exchange factor GrpE [Halobacteriota archaeon]|nr:nucleotide exchange factor GrpE [Halobacteriota archaeon]